MAFPREEDYPLYLSLCKHCYHQFAHKDKDAKHCHRCTEMMQLKSENTIQAQRIRHLEYECVRLSKEKDEIGDLKGEIARLKRALSIADEAVNIATGE